MPAYENMMVTVAIFLIFVNAFFIFASDLPGAQFKNTDGTINKIQIGITPKDLNDMNNRINGIINQQGVFNPPADSNSLVTASGSQVSYLTLFQSWLFGVLNVATLGIAGSLINATSLFGSIISIFGATFFGYLFWIDFFIPPVTMGLIAVGIAIKGFLLVVQLLGIFDYVFRMFYAGTAVRG